MNDFKYKLNDWYFRQNTFVRVILHILSQAPYFILGWFIGELIFK